MQRIAREALPDNINSIDDIIKALRARIKPDNSKVIAGRIAALHVRNGNFQEFSKQVEDLADALERSLVIEGITKVKAQEIAVEQTVSVCRLNARTDLVKSILASTPFSNPKEVVAKLVVEQTNEVKEKQVLAFRYSNNANYQNDRCSYRRNNFSSGSFRGNLGTYYNFDCTKTSR